MYKIDNEILEGLANGKTQTQIAKELGVTKATISYKIKKMKKQNIEIPNTLTEKNEEIDKKIFEELKNGKTQTQIAKEMDIQRVKIAYRVKKMKEKKRTFNKSRD